MPYLARLSAVAAVTVLGVSAANATPVTPVTVTASSSFPTYLVSNATDTGANRFATDYASNGQGVNTSIVFDFGTGRTFDSVVLTDRTTSGGANGTAVYGTTDFTTRFSLTFSNDATFATGVTTTTVTRATPTTQTLAAFQSTVAVPNITARYIRYNVLATNGANPGLADITFDAVTTTVPEPASLLLLGLGLAAAGVVRRRSV